MKIIITDLMKFSDNLCMDAAESKQFHDVINIAHDQIHDAMCEVLIDSLSKMVHDQDMGYIILNSVHIEDMRTFNFKFWPYKLNGMAMVQGDQDDFFHVKLEYTADLNSCSKKITNAQTYISTSLAPNLFIAQSKGSHNTFIVGQGYYSSAAGSGGGGGGGISTYNGLSIIKSTP